MTKNPKVTVFGAGVWGSVLAQHLAKKGCPVTLWEHFPHLLHEIEKHGRQHPHIPHFKFEPEITLTSSLEEAASAEFFVLAISSKAARHFAQSLERHLKTAIPLASASKGLEEETGFTVCEIIEDAAPKLRGMTMALSGPSFALEVARGVPTKLLLAGPDNSLLEQACSVLDGFPLRVETSPDRRGVEWAGAAKNVFAIACGMADGNPRLGANTRAALLTQAVKEMSLIITAAGGRAETAQSLASLGDLMLTGTNEISRNHKLGVKLAQGKALAQARGEIDTVTEGADAAEAVFRLAQAKRLDAPLAAAMRKILREAAPPETLLKALGF
ncbi:MAG: NAD(P)H-dependent glycerol-3-phosphate dehydrogenase [Elusimicrobiales bacterium]